MASFARLDARFRLPEALWSELPQYADYGFAVFKLRERQEQRIHPMAFHFETRHRFELFFPTLHIHYGDVAERAMFDHVLYCQGEVANVMDGLGWRRSHSPLSDVDKKQEQLSDQREDPGAFVVEFDPSDASEGDYLSASSTRGLIDFDSHAWKVEIYGERVNDDVVVALNGN